jgi:hypothetical protein
MIIIKYIIAIKLIKELKIWDYNLNVDNKILSNKSVKIT